MVTAWQFPAGMGRLPGPGFFPAIIGVVMVVLAGLLVVVSVRSQSIGELTLANRKQLAWTVALVVVYLLAWGWVPFALRTVVFGIVLLRLLGQQWRAAVTFSAVLTIAVVLAFQYGLRVDLQ